MIVVKRVLAILTVAVLVGAFGYRFIREAEVKAMEPLLSARAMIFDRVSAMIKTPAIIEYAARHPANCELRDCLQAGGQCSALSANRQRPVVIPSSLDGDGPLFAGTPYLPARYDARAQPCAKNCAWEAEAFFWFAEEATGGEFKKALQVRLVVRPLEAFDWPLQGQPQSTPPAKEFRAHPERFAFRVAIPN